MKEYMKEVFELHKIVKHKSQPKNLKKLLTLAKRPENQESSKVSRRYRNVRMTPKR